MDLLAQALQEPFRVYLEARLHRLDPVDRLDEVSRRLLRKLNGLNQLGIVMTRETSSAERTTSGGIRIRTYLTEQEGALAGVTGGLDLHGVPFSCIFGSDDIRRPRARVSPKATTRAGIDPPSQENRSESGVPTMPVTNRYHQSKALGLIQ